MQKILILGAKGMLGSELTKLYRQVQADNPGDCQVFAWDIDEVDVRDFQKLTSKLQEIWPDIIYNAVAYNAVDSCEEDDEEYAKAKVLNIDLPKKLAEIANNLGSTFIHYSSDYVFDGERPKYKNGQRAPYCCGHACDGCQYEGREETISYWQYAEDDQPNPLNRYGYTKWRGEQAVEEVGGDYYLIRLSKLFGGDSKNNLAKKSFFEVMWELGLKHPSVKAVDGELSKFTYAPDLARASQEIVENREPNGIYHLVNEGVATWFEGVQTLYDLLNLKTKITPVGPEEFPRPARRPAVSVLQNRKRPPLRPYQEALREWIENKKMN